MYVLQSLNIAFIIANIADPDTRQNYSCLNPLGLDIMFVASSSQPLPSLFKLCLLGSCCRRHMICLLVEVLHRVNLVNITHVKS